MSHKGSPSSKTGTEPKRQWKMMTIAEKEKLLDMLKEGQIFAAAARHFGMNKSSGFLFKYRTELIYLNTVLHSSLAYLGRV